VDRLVGRLRGGSSVSDTQGIKHHDALMQVVGHDPRIAFMEELIRIGETDDRLVMLDADVSRRTLTTRYREQHPDRFWNLGIAEQNVLGVCAGLAAAGRIPFAFAFGVFMSMRALEQLRTSICYPRLHATVVGGYAGLSNGKDGATHQSIEDIGITRCLPNLVVMSPSDSVMARKMARAAYEHDGPTYIRMEYEDSAVIHTPDLEFHIGQGYRVREGRDVTLATYGIALARAVAAASALEAAGISLEVIDMPTLKPFDRATLVASVRKTGRLITLEDHNVIGGLASASCDALVDAQVLPAFRALAIGDVFTESGPSMALRAKFGLDEPAIVRAAHELMAVDGPAGGRDA
jgi:transketolase